MKWQSLVVLGVCLVLASPAAAVIPTTWIGNNYTGGGGSLTMAWRQWPDPVFPQMTWEYRNDRVTQRFTASSSGTVAAVQLYTSTPSAKFGYLDPQLTVSIQTDDGTGKPSGTIVGSSYSFTYDYYGPTSGNWIGGVVTAPLGSAPVTAGNVYHVVMVVDNLSTPSQCTSGGDYANSRVDFRLTASGGGTPIQQVRTYDGTTDSNLINLYYNQTQGGAYENQWMEGSPKANDYYPDGHSDSQRRPLFEMFASYDAQTQTVSNPVAGLAQGYNASYVEGGSGGGGTEKGRPIEDNNDALGEKFVAHYPTANPVAKGARVYIRKQTQYGTVDPDGDVLIEVRDNTNTVVASGTVLTASIPFDDQYMWAEATLDTDVPLVDGQTYYVSARSPNLTVGRYRVGAHSNNDDTLLPGQENSFYGTEAVLVEDYATSGVTWTEQVARDISFALAVVIPGDANGDGAVNVGDLGILGANYGQSPRDWLQADFNGDQIVNVGDLGILGAHYGEHLPEPATIGLLVLGGLAVLRRRRR